MKKVLLIIIDALASRIVEPALKEGLLPNIGHLVERGSVRFDSTSIFPSITPAATCSIVTGAYPFEHGIAGAYWYDQSEDEIAYFGSDILAIINEGMASYVNDFQVRLNVERLQVPTLFEHIEEHGALTDGVINFMWYRGTVDHETATPLTMKLLPGVTLVEKMRGPHFMYLGDFISTPLYGTAPSARGGLLRRFGFHDDATADYLHELARQDALPDFTLAYFPNNDFDSHSEGPENALSTLQNVDKNLGTLFEICGGVDQMLNEFAILITGDHSQSDLDDEHVVNLNEVLGHFKLAETGKSWSDSDDLVVCPNMRSAQIYMRSSFWDRRVEVIDSLLACDDVDQVIWCDEENGLHDTNKATYHVRTRNRGELTFRPATGESGQGKDCYGMAWEWQGELSNIDARLTSEGRIEYGEYPNAFERIAAGFFGLTGNLWVTAQLGKEFCLPELSCNKAGSHGSLHQLDSTSPLITAGLPQDIELPATPPRLIDIMPICMQVLGLDPPRKAGSSAIVHPINTVG